MRVDLVAKNKQKTGFRYMVASAVILFREGGPTTSFFFFRIVVVVVVVPSGAKYGCQGAS